MSKSTISFLVFIVLVVVIFIGASVFSNLGKGDVPAVVNPVSTSTPVSGAGTVSAPVPALTNTAKTDIMTNTSTGITMADVQKHNGASSCWTVVNSGVYDLTSFTSKHPGGSNAILSLCGIDGTSAFFDQHGNQRRPNNELAGLKIGDLAK